MKTRVLVAASAAAFLLSIASSQALAGSVEGAASPTVLVTVCGDSMEWVVVTQPTAGSADALMGFMGSPLLMLDAAASGQSTDCDGLFLATPTDWAAVPELGAVRAQDAAVWSRGQQPAVRVSEAR